MKKNFFLTLMLLVVMLFAAQPTVAQAPEATPEGAITALLNRIGGAGAADKFEIVIDESLAENGKDVFVITSSNGKPCIKGNTQLSVATGINWYLNHYAHINLTWNNLTTDLSQVELPVPSAEEKRVCNTTYRYDFNTCTFSYSMAFWTWERWQQEIDWMALHGINAPLNLVGLDVVTRKFLQELGVSDDDINAYIAGPGFIAWFAMNNLEGWGGTINSSSTGVDMSGNPDWWYARQEQLCRNMLQRMRELGMQPVIPGFSGQVPDCIRSYDGKIEGFSSSDVLNNGTWAGGYTRPDMLYPNSTSYKTFAAVYYKHLHEVMGPSEFYSIDPFHEGGIPTGVTNETCYPYIMAELDENYNALESTTKEEYNAPAENPKWIIQYWQGIPQTGAFSAMNSDDYKERFIGLDLFADNIYADNAAKWRDGNVNSCYFKGRPYIYCMLHNFGGRSGLHGRLETTMDGYFEALAKGNNCQGIGATPEGTETNPILYDMLFELPWMDVDNRPTADEWLEDYAYSRYGIENETAIAALKNLKESVWNCTTNQQGTSEAVILARPAWNVGKVSTWSTSAIYWDTQDVLLAADQLYSIKNLVTANGGEDGIANYNYDFIDVVRQSMVDYAAQLLPLINAARTAGNSTEYERLYNIFLQLMLDLDTMLSYDENFKLERWTSLARNIADEGSELGYAVTDNDRNWLEWNARTQVTVWAHNDNDLHDYSNRCWAGLIKDFHYKRWEKFFTTNGGSFDGGWYSGFEYPWTVDFNDTYNFAGDYSEVVIPEGSATEKAAETFGNYFGRVKGAEKNYIFPMGIATDGTDSDVIPTVYRGQTVELPLEIGNGATISTVQIDLNADGTMGDGETLTATGLNVEIPETATIGKTTATVTLSDGTEITFNLALIEEITTERTVTATTADATMGTVAIEGDEDGDGSITNTAAVKMTATANTGYNFYNWTDAQGNIVSNDNPYIYYAKEEAGFTANFIEDKWGVVACNGTFSADIAGYGQFIHNLTFAYYNRDAETILETTTAPTEIFNTIPQIINVPRGASFDVEYDDGSGDGLKYCYFRAYIDLNADGDFDDEGELLKEVGTNGSTNTAVCSNKINVLFPYDMPLGITHMRLRFDGAWDNSNNPSGRGAKDASIRPVYEIIINVTEGSDKYAHIEVKSNSEEWGTVECWTNETPGWTAAQEWDVSANINMNIKAIPASDDVEFLGWYDHYGRLFSTELEYSGLAIEDATYTAKFRRTLEIDGWEFEYRTEPGTELKVVGELEDGVTPEAGKMYYIAADNKQSDGSYIAHYLYDNSGTLATTTTVSGDSYIWTCIVNDDNTYSFQNASGNYLANASDYDLSIGATPAQYSFETAVHKGVSLLNATTGYTGSKYMVTKVDGTSFDHNSTARNDVNWSSDYIFTEVTYPEVVILTAVRETGDHDLEIPGTVNILGEDLEIVGFDNGLFANNKDLWTISLPATIQTFSNNNKVFCGVVNGKGDNENANSANYITTDLGTTLTASEDWSISMTVEDNGNNFNEWGSALIATGNAPMNSTYANGFQLYMQSTSNGGKLIVKLDNDNNNYALASISKGTKYRIDIVYTHSNTQLVVTATSLETASSVAAARTVAARSTNSLTLTQDISDFSVVSHAIPEGVNITNLSVYKGTETDPFEGCTNLIDITVADASENYYVSDRALYASSGTLLHTLADEEKEEEIRALGELIDATKALAEELTASLDPTGTATEVTLSTTEGEDYYIYSNAEIREGSIGNLLDENNETYIHTTWEKDSEDGLHHYLRVYLGDNPDLSYFSFSYVTRNNTNTEKPKQITVSGCATVDGTYETIDVITGLPGESAKTYNSSVYEVKEYKYLRFMVDDTYRDLSNSGHKAYSMAKFDLYKITSSATVANEYDSFFGVTASEVTTLYDTMLDALYYYNNDATAEELTAAYNELEPLYTALKEKVAKLTITIPESGMTTFCYPFNLELPTGVTAHDLTKDQLTAGDVVSLYELSNVAAEGDVLAKSTPVIVKAAGGEYVFTNALSDADAKGSTEGTVLRGTLEATTIDNTDDALFNYTFNNGTFSLVTAETNIDANRCWAELSEDFGASIVDEALSMGPFVLTTDEENPLLYNIISGRYENNDSSNDHLVLQYDKSDGKVPLKTLGENNVYQAWYFMKGTADGSVLIKPFNADGKTIGATSVSNAAGSVSTSADNTYYEWFIVESPTTGWYNIYTVVDESKYYFSNFGGIGNKMGFWDGDANESMTKSDGGSQFQFIEAEFGNDNARYYQLEDLLSTMDITTQAMDGDAPGCRDGGDAHFDAYIAATGYINEGNTVAAGDCYTAYTTLRATRAALGEMKMPVDGAVYRIKNYISLSPDEYKYHYIANNNAAISFPTEADNSTTLWVCVAGENGTYKFVSAMGTATLGWQKAAGKDDIQEFSIETGVERGAVALNNSGVNLSLRNEAHDKGLGFDQASNNVTAQVVDWSTDWLLEPVADANVYYRRTLGNGYQWGTLYLPFAVEVPAGITAYYATLYNVGETTITLTDVGTTIPSYTPVLICRSVEDSKSRTDYDFTLTADVQAIGGNIFEGSILTSYIECQENYRYYLLLNASKGEAFYWIKHEYNEYGGSGDTHIKCDANKAYLSVDTSSVSPSSYYRFEFEDGSTTGVEELECENGKAETIYDLQGRRLTEITEPGVYIIDGNKVLVK